MANVASFLKQEPGAIPVTSNQHVQLPFQAAWKTKSTHVEKGDWLEEMFGCLGFRETFLLKEGSVDKEDPLRTANLGPQKDMCWISHQRLLKKWSHHVMARPGQPGQPRGTKTWQQGIQVALPAPGQQAGEPVQDTGRQQGCRLWCSPWQSRKILQQRRTGLTEEKQRGAFFNVRESLRFAEQCWNLLEGLALAAEKYCCFRHTAMLHHTHISTALSRQRIPGLECVCKMQCLGKLQPQNLRSKELNESTGKWPLDLGPSNTERFPELFRDGFL